MTEVLTITVPKGFTELVDKYRGDTPRSRFIVLNVKEAMNCPDCNSRKRIGQGEGGTTLAE